MSLRRTALQRKSELRRTPLERKKPMARARAVRDQVAKARRDTGPDEITRAQVSDRALGCCEICGARIFAGGLTERAFSVHHRVPRGMGGSRVEWINSPANLLLLCGSGVTGCHGHVEANRAEAYDNGWLIGGRRDPSTVPVLLEGSDWYLLDHDGDRKQVQL